MRHLRYEGYVGRMAAGARLRTRGAAGITVLALAATLLGSAPAVATTAERPASAPAAVAALASDPPPPPDLTQPMDYANAVQVRIYRMRHAAAEEAPVDAPRSFTHTLLGRGTTGDRNWQMISIGHLIAEERDDNLQLVVDPDDLYIRGFYRRVENRLFLYAGTDIPEALVPGAARTEMPFPVNYRDLEGMTINRANITRAVADLLENNDLGERGALRNAMETMAVTFAETARNQLINHEVYTALRGAGDWVVGGHAPATTSWNQMGGVIRSALADGDWTTPRGSYILDGQHGGHPAAYSATYLSRSST